MPRKNKPEDGVVMTETLLPWKDIRTFGAKGDGIADDTQAIQSALNSLVKGGVIQFPPGTFRTTRPLIWPQSDGISLVGAGDRASRIWFDFGGTNTGTLPEVAAVAGIYIRSHGEGDNGHFIEGITFSGLTFQGGNFDGPPDNSSCYELVSIFGNVRRVLVEGCTFKWGRHSGLRFANNQPGVQDVVVTGCRFEEINTGTMTTPLQGGALLGFHVNQIRVTDCTFVDIGLYDSPPHFHAVYLTQCDDAVVKGCVFDGAKNPFTRLHLTDGLRNASVIGNTFIGQDINFFTSIDGGTVTGNALVNTTLAATGHGTVVANNSFRWDELRPGSMLTDYAGGGSSGVVVSGNSFLLTGEPDFTSDSWAIRFMNTQNGPWLISGNTFANMRVATFEGGSGHIFSNNFISSPTHVLHTHPLVMFHQGMPDMLAIGNVVETEGMSFSDASGNVTFQGNFFRGNAVVRLPEGNVLPGKKAFKVDADQLFTTPVATANLPGASPLFDGRLVVEDDGNLVLYAQSKRFRISATEF